MNTTKKITGLYALAGVGVALVTLTSVHMAFADTAITGDIVSEANGISAEGAVFTQGQEVIVSTGVENLSNSEEVELRLIADGARPGDAINIGGETVCNELFGTEDCAALMSALAGTTTATSGPFMPVDEVTVTIDENAPVGEWNLRYFLVTNVEPFANPHETQMFTFTVEAPVSSAITSPAEDAEVALDEVLELAAHDEGAKDGNVQWAVREGACGTATSTVFGNVDGFSSDYDWTDGLFTASTSIADWNTGDHCFIFNPADGERLTRDFDIVEAEITEPEPDPTPGAITSPTTGAEIALDEILELAAHDVDAKDGTVQWAVREGTCGTATSTVFGNVDGFSDTYTWTSGLFTASTSISDWNTGDHCFIFNPADGERLTRDFDIVEAEITEPEPEPGKPTKPEKPTLPEPRDIGSRWACMFGGWEDQGFRNQGQCIKFAVTGKDSR